MAKCIEKAESHCKSYPRGYGCNAYRELTNADRIRSMSDEELCEMLTMGTGGFDCGVCRDNNECDRECEWHCAEWLKHPALTYPLERSGINDL